MPKSKNKKNTLAFPTRETSKLKMFREAIAIGAIKNNTPTEYHSFTEGDIEILLNIQKNIINKAKRAAEPVLIHLKIEFLVMAKEPNPNEPNYYMDQFRDSTGNSRYFITNDDPAFDSPKNPKPAGSWTRRDLHLSEISKNAHSDFTDFVDAAMMPWTYSINYVEGSPATTWDEILETFYNDTATSTAPKLIWRLTKRIVTKDSSSKKQSASEHFRSIQARGIAPKNSRFLIRKDHFDNSKDDRCVLDYLDHQYNNPKYLATIFKDNDQNINTYFDTMYPKLYDGEEWDKKCVTPDMLMAFAKKHNISCYLMDGCKKVIMSFRGERHCKSICGAITSEHFYPIYDTDHIRAISEKAQDVSTPTSILIHEPKKKYVGDPMDNFWTRCKHKFIESTTDNITQYIYELYMEHDVYEDLEELYIVDIHNFKHVCDLARKNKHILNGDIETSYLCNESKFRRFIAVAPEKVDIEIYVPFSKYNMINNYCNYEGIIYKHTVTVGSISTDLAHEYLDIEHTDMNHCRACDKYISGTDIYKRYRVTYDEDDDNIHILCKDDFNNIGNKRLCDYRVEKGYYKGAGSHYNNDVIEHIIGTAERPIKSKAFTKTVNIPEYLQDAYDYYGRVKNRRITTTNNIVCRDLSKAHSIALYQGSPTYVKNTAGVLGLQAFDFKDFEWPVFTAYDEIEETNIMFQKGARIPPGYYWVEFPDGRGPSTYDNIVCYTNGKFTAPTIYWFINFYKCEFKITHQLVASECKPAGYYRNMINNLTSVFPGNEKFIVNYYIGDATKSFKKQVSELETTSLSEAMNAYLNIGQIPLNKIEPIIIDYLTYYKVKSFERKLYQVNSLSHYDMIIEMTQVSLLDLYQRMVKLDTRVLNHKTIDFKTDSITIELLGDDFDHDINMTDPYSKIEGTHLLTNVNSHKDVVIINPDSFKHVVKEFGYTPNLLPKPKDPVMNHVISSYSEDTPKNKIIRDVLEKSGVSFTKSLCIEGRAGTGKTHLGAAIMYGLVESGCKVKILSFTNRVAELFQSKYNLPGQTIHTGLGISSENMDVNKFPRDVEVVLIDEMSMIPSKLLQVMLEIKRAYNVQFIILGCWEQNDSVEDKTLADIEQRERSVLFRELCDYQKINLTKNVRACDKVYNLCESILSNKNAPPHIVIGDFISKNVYNHNSDIMRGVCYYNETRVKWNVHFNQKWMDKIYPTLPYNCTKDVMFQEFYNKSNSTQTKSYSDTLTYNIPIISRSTSRKFQIRNGQEFTVYAWGTEVVTKKVDDKNVNYNIEKMYLLDKTGVRYPVDLDWFLKNCTLGFCMTHYVCQGIDISQPYVIVDVDRMDYRGLYVSISRTSNIDYLHFDNSHMFEHRSSPPTTTISKPFVRPTKSLYKYLTNEQQMYNPMTSHVKLSNGDDSVLSHYNKNIDNILIVRDEHDMVHYAFKDVNTFERCISDYDEQALHEVVSPTLVQRIYFDLDLNLDTFIQSMATVNANVNREYAMDLLYRIAARINHLVHQYTKSVDSDKIRINENMDVNDYFNIFTSHGERKLSMHIMTQVYCNNQAIARHIFKIIRTDLIRSFLEIPTPLLEQIIDCNMSRRWGSLRIYGSSKLSDLDRIKTCEHNPSIEMNNTLIGWYECMTAPPVFIYDMEIYEADTVQANTDIQKSIIDIMSIRDSDFTNVWSFRDKTYWCDRKKSSHCEICDRTHENDNTLYFSIKDTTISMCCSRTKRRIIIT